MLISWIRGAIKTKHDVRVKTYSNSNKGEFDRTRLSKFLEHSLLLSYNIYQQDCIQQHTSLHLYTSGT